MPQIKFRDENSASGALVELLRASPTALAAFWKLARRADAPRILPKDMIVDHRHRTDQRREIDILLYRDDFGIIVECKVDDGKKAYQFDPYVAYWKREHGTMPHLVWLLDRIQPVLGDDQFPVTTITWRMLKVELLNAAPSAAAIEGELIRQFCSALTAAGIGQEDKIQRAKRAKGYEEPHAKLILGGILEQLNDVAGSLLRMNALTPALHVGKPDWSRLLDDPWVKRVWLYFKPLDKMPDAKAPYFLQAQILLFQGGYSNKASSKLRLVPRWASALRAQGLRLARNEQNTWSRGVDLQPHEGVHLGVRWIVAEESIADAQKRWTFDWRSDDEAIEQGTAHVQHYIELFDRVLKTT